VAYINQPPSASDGQQKIIQSCRFTHHNLMTTQHEITLIEEKSIASRIFSQVWQRGEKCAHVVFYVEAGQTRAGSSYAQGNTAAAVQYVASWTSRRRAFAAHRRFCADRA
jgi:hypothetical protein